ncbi:electron transport complex subunit RsxC [Vibrio sp. LaRot3]|uniref:electron transport complex subunit RsxC n=1 Tax=Vibrio sp. LaRot3 TaxID=2998829 RepID=UPI0022CDD166|nr:electron transport complex subunit RsxC [Vibrio sp. LaRot3]MDA0146997.1 electron transport complex subunit RsxC [Vibrio sp. LaRot3]
MLSLIEKIKSGALWDFPGGVHPPENKKQSLKTPIARASIPQEIVLPIKQHIGKPGNLIVNVGDNVLKGQPLTKYDMSFMLPVHAPTSGTITAIEPRTTAHPSGLSEMCVVIKPDNQEQWIDRNPIEDFTANTPDELIEVIRQAGVSGMGGAGFPTAKKIQSGLARTEIFIVNAAECEPYITADDILMQEHADALIQGIEIVEHILKPKLTIIGIEDNKPKAIKALEKAAQHKDIVIRVIPTKYPSGGEKQLIKVLTNKEVPNNGIPADIGLLVQNVGSLYAIQRAVCHGEPLIERIVTLTGKTFKQPQNVWTLIGTSVEDLLSEFGYKADKKLPRLIMGGPMMGFTLPHSAVPITKTANCILAPTRREIASDQYEMACIRCGQCAEACPASLLPQQLQWHAKAEEFDKCEELNLKDCIECGACAFVCPSEIPLVQYYRQAKAEIRTRKEEAEAAERAKQRFEEKKARLERDKAERENRFKKAADDRRKEMKQTGGDDAIAAAIARVKAQKADSTDKPAEPAVKPAVAAAIAKAKAKQAAAQKAGQAEPDNSEMAKLREERKRLARERKAEKEQSSDSTDKKDAVAAAIARAKAKKAAASAPPKADNSPADSGDKKAAIAAAIARAKAKKAATESNTPESDNGDNKKAAIASAVARAKARKAEQQAGPNQESSETAEPEQQLDPKKAAVAAAIARAKARKAEQQASANQESSESVVPEQAQDSKKAAVAAAIARAKARKAEQQAEANQESSETVEPEQQLDPKKAAVAAAIARAKARKAEQQADASQESSGTVEPEQQLDPKKAAVAAAIARAKARKAEQQADASQESSETVEPEQELDPKKAAVAAAIARAKARKAEQQADANQKSSETVEPEQELDPKKAAVAAAIARAKARKAEQEKMKQSEEKE